jgi:shikimate dehydrogenase
MDRYAVIGNPIKHSLSPAMHNAAFKELGVKAKYEALEVKSLKKSYPELKKKYKGINVTIPHKVDILDLVDRKEVLSDLVGAANCVRFENGRKATAYNTDVYGAVEALKMKVKTLKGKKVLVLGAGGAARAIVFGCLLEGCKVSVCNRTAEKALELAIEADEKLSKKIKIVDEIKLQGIDILVNATSVGMSPDSGNTPLTSPIPSNVGRKLIVMDIVYNPIETKLLKQAKAAGAKTIDGIDMFVLQGAESLRIWGFKPPISVMRNAVLKELKKRS